MTPKTITATILGVLALALPFVTGHIPANAIQTIATVASIVGSIAVYISNALAPNAAQLAARGPVVK